MRQTKSLSNSAILVLIMLIMNGSKIVDPIVAMKWK